MACSGSVVASPRADRSPDFDMGAVPCHGSPIYRLLWSAGGAGVAGSCHLVADVSVIRDAGLYSRHASSMYRSIGDMKATLARTSSVCAADVSAN